MKRNPVVLQVLIDRRVSPATFETMNIGEIQTIGGKADQ